MLTINPVLKKTFTQAATALLFIAALFQSPARANEDSAPATNGYKVPWYSKFFATGLEACTYELNEGLSAGLYTNIGFIPPVACSATFDDKNDSYPPADRVIEGMIGEVSICPGGKVSSPLGYYSLIDDQKICRCSPNEKFFPDAIGAKKCVVMIQISSTSSPPSHPSDHGPSCRKNGSPSCGQPINPGTGNMWHIETDYVAANLNSGLALRRTYNSSPFNWDANGVRMFGKRWTQQYEVIVAPAAAIPLQSPQTYTKCWRREDTREIKCEMYPQLVQIDLVIPDAISVLRWTASVF